MKNTDQEDDDIIRDEDPDDEDNNCCLQKSPGTRATSYSGLICNSFHLRLLTTIGEQLQMSPLHHVQRATLKTFA